MADFAPGAPAAAPMEGEASEYPLGAARAQLHGTYIVAQTRDGVVIVDQHAAHERLTHEKLKNALADGGVQRQILLIPEVVEMDEPSVSRLAARSEELAKLGLVLEAFGPGAVVVRETPALLGETDVQGLVRDLADELAEMGETLALADRVVVMTSRPGRVAHVYDMGTRGTSGDAVHEAAAAEITHLLRSEARRMEQRGA